MVGPVISPKRATVSDGACRSVPEWQGKTPDDMPPPRVQLRIFRRYEGVCQITKRKIAPGDKWTPDHILALCNGGRNVESNLWPVLTAAHPEKTAQDLAERASNDARARSHAGIPKRVVEPPPMQGPKFTQSSKAAKRAARGHKPAMAPRIPRGFESAAARYEETA